MFNYFVRGGRREAQMPCQEDSHTWRFVERLPKEPPCWVGIESNWQKEPPTSGQSSPLPYFPSPSFYCHSLYKRGGHFLHISHMRRVAPLHRTIDLKGSTLGSEGKSQPLFDKLTLNLACTHYISVCSQEHTHLGAIPTVPPVPVPYHPPHQLAFT